MTRVIGHHEIRAERKAVGLGAELFLTLAPCGSRARVADLSLQLMGSLIVIQVSEFLAPIVRVRLGAQQIVGSQQQPVRVARAEAGVPVSSPTLHLNRLRRRNPSAHDGIGHLEMTGPAFLNRL